MIVGRAHTHAVALCSLLALAACSKPTASEEARDADAGHASALAPPRDAALSLNLTSDASPAVDRQAVMETSPKEAFAIWLKARLPPGGAVEGEAGMQPKVVHTVASGDTALSIATAYLDLTDIYMAADLAAAISKGAASITAGAKIEIPHLIEAPYKEPEADRLGWPEDKILRGVFVTGAYAAILWVPTLDKLAARKLNAVVLDGKDYMGPITYPTKVKLAVETGAMGKAPFIPDLKRAIRFAHARGIRVIMRIACFHDPFMQKHAPRLSIMGTWGKPFDMGWLDPTNEEAQNYIIDLAREQIDAGADEIQLDYIRFPVHGGLKSAVMPPPHGERTIAIRDFVRRVHQVTQPRKVALSLDIFGVTATGDKEDWLMLGQDISVLGPEVEALSPMVYPSHYSDGYHGFDKPGAHPEVIGIGTKAAVKQLTDANVKGCVIRSWLQAFGWKAPNYGPKYLVDEAREAETNGGVGWLMWSPSNDYNAAWLGFHAVKE